MLLSYAKRIAKETTEISVAKESGAILTLFGTRASPFGPLSC